MHITKEFVEKVQGVPNVRSDAEYRLGFFEHIKHFDLDKAPVIIAIYIQALRNLLRAGSDKQNYDLIVIAHTLPANRSRAISLPLAQTQDQQM